MLLFHSLTIQVKQEEIQAEQVLNIFSIRIDIQMTNQAMLVYAV